jgi:hypothetical protein
VKAQAVTLDPPQTKAVAVHHIIATWAVRSASATSSPPMRPPPDTTAWAPSSYAAIHARTGRLLI